MVLRWVAKKGIWGTLMLLLPFVVETYWLYLINLVLIAILGAAALNLLLGNIGQVSIGNAAFMAIGAFATAIATEQLDLPFWLAIPFAGLVAAIVGLLIGFPALRLRGLYILLATLALHFIVYVVVRAYQVTFFGMQGVPIPRPQIGPLRVSSDVDFYYFLLPIAAFTVYFFHNLLRTREGRAFMAVRDRDIAAAIIGINVARSKLRAFVISSFFIGVGGSLYAFYVGHIAADTFHLDIAIAYAAMCIVGGMGSVLGSVLGAAFMTLVPHIVSSMVNSIRSVSPELYAAIGHYSFQIMNIIYGLIIIVFLIFQPQGLAGFWHKIRAWAREWPYSY